MRGGAVGGSVVINARDQAEAQAKVEAMLRKKGTAWDTITVVKGRDQGLTMKGGGLERYYHELTALLGIGNFNLYAWSSNEPSPMWASADLMPDPDGTAQTWWTKFMDESSHGLAVSDFPRFIICDVEGYPTLPLPAEFVRDPKRWDRITTVMRDQLDYWKARLQERIERLGKVEQRSAEDAEQLEKDKATLKELEAFDGWSYEAYVNAMLPGRVPHPLDLDNPRLYRLSNGQLIPITNLGPDQLRVDFGRRLLELRDGPRDKWADAVREFLDHHHHNGGKAEPFRDLVKITAQRLRDMVKGANPRNTERWGLLADKLDVWLSVAMTTENNDGEMEGLNAAPRMATSDAASDPEVEAKAFHEEQLRDYIPGLSICPFPLHLSVGTRETYPDIVPGVSVNYTWMRRADQWSDIARAVKKQVDRLPEGPLKDRFQDWTYASIAPEGRPNAFDIPNPRTYLLDGTQIPTTPYWNAVVLSFHRTLIAIWTRPQEYPPNRKVETLHQYLDHHFDHGGNPRLLVEYVERVGPSFNRNTVTGVRTPVFPEGLQKELAAWVVSARKRLGSPAKVKAGPKAVKPSGPSLASKFEPVPGSLDKWMNLLRSEGLVDAAGRFTMADHAKGKGKLIAAWVAALEVFSLVAYPLDTELSKALIAHLPGLSGLDRLDKVRKTKSFTDNVERYKEALQDD